VLEAIEENERYCWVLEDLREMKREELSALTHKQVAQMVDEK
jgi:hypothetical protein